MENSKESKSIKISLKQLIISIFIIIFIVLLIIVILNVLISKINNTEHYLKEIKVKTGVEIDTLKQTSDDVEIVPTLLDEIKDNSAWCGVFQLIWNDMKNNLIKKDIIFNKQIKMVENLNKETFKAKDISDSYYYKTWGTKSLNLKAKIEEGIKEKFDQTSDILDSINWTESNPNAYIFYGMLYKEFNFKNDFNTLDNDSFYSGTKTYTDIEYFGISKDSSSKLYSQVDVLYYNSKSDFAIVLNTKENDEVILTIGDNGATFADIYNCVVQKAEEFEGNTEFGKNDFLKVPNLDFNISRNFYELTTDGSDKDKYFTDFKNQEYYLNDAIQNISLKLDKSGGRVKSEAIVSGYTFGDVMIDEVEKRYFYFNQEFTIFIKEKGKDVPYFAANVSNIELFQ